MTEFSATIIPIILVLIIVTLIAIIIIINSGKKKNTNATEIRNDSANRKPPKSDLPKQGKNTTDFISEPSDNSPPARSNDNNNTNSDMDLAAELEKLKAKRRAENARSDTTRSFQVLNNPPNDAMTQANTKQKQHSASKRFLPLEDEQTTKIYIPKTPNQSDIPDNIFRQNTRPNSGVLAIPYRIINLDGVLGCVIFDWSGLPISHATKSDIFDKENIAAFSAESLRVMGKLGNPDESKIQWFNAWIGNQTAIVIMKDGTGCTIILEKNSDIMQISNLAMSVISEITIYRPKEYA